MSERNINTVQVSTSRGIVAMPWASREALLAEFNHLDSMQQVREKFDAVGTTQPVELTTAEKGNLVACIDFWSSKIEGGFEGMPEGLFELRNALHVDLHDAHHADTGPPWLVSWFTRSSAPLRNHECSAV